MRASLREGIPANIIANLLGGPLQTAYLLYLGFNSGQIGIITAIPSLTLVAQLFIAIGMQRWSNRRLLLTILGTLHRSLWTLTGLIPLLFPESSWFLLCLVLYFFSFVSAQSSGVIWTSLMADIVPAGVRGRYFGFRNTVHWAVASLTLLLGGQWMERSPDREGFLALFAICAISTLWNGWELSRHPNLPFERSGGGASLSLLVKPLRDRAFLSAAIFISVFLLFYNIVVPLFSYAMLNVLHLDYAKVTLVIMVQNIVMMLSYVYWGNLNAKYPTRTLLLWTFPILSSACVIWIGLAALPVLAVLIAAHLLLGFGLSGYNLLVFNFLIGDTPKSDRPLYVAMFSALTGLAGFIGPIIGGRLFEAAAGAPDWLQRYGIVLFCGAAMLSLSLVVARPVFRSHAKHK